MENKIFDSAIEACRKLGPYGRYMLAIPIIPDVKEEKADHQEEPKSAQRPAERPPEGYKLDYRYIEKKTRRLQLVFQPSLYERVKAVAEKAGLSINDYVSQTLDRATRLGV